MFCAFGALDIAPTWDVPVLLDHSNYLFGFELCQLVVIFIGKIRNAAQKKSAKKFPATWKLGERVFFYN